MWGQVLVQSVAILWLVQTAQSRGYGAASGLSNGQGPQLNGNHPLNSGLGRLLLPANGVGSQPGYGGYPTKGIGYGASAGVNNGGNTKGYGAAAGLTNGQGSKPQGYGAQAGPVNGQQVKGPGYGAHAGGFGGQGTKGIGFGAAAGALGVNGAKHNGNGAAASAHYGFGTKGNGQGAIAGSANRNGAKPQQGAAGNKPMKGYGRPPYGAVKGPGAGMGAFRGLGAPQHGRNQGKAYNSNGYKGYGAQPNGGYNGGYGSAGLGLGSQYGPGAIKGPKQGYGGAAAARPNGQGAKPNGYGYPSGGATKPAKPGYGNALNGFNSKQKGYGAPSGGAVRPQTGFGNRPLPNGYGTKPNGYEAAAGAGAQKPNGYGVRNGAALGGYGNKLNGYGAGSNPQTTKGAHPPSQADKTLGTGAEADGTLTKGYGASAGGYPYGGGAKANKPGYGGAAGVVDGQLTKAAKSGYGVLPNGNAAGASIDQGLRILSPEQLNPAPHGVVPQPAVPEPTSGILVMVTPEQYQNLLSPVPQGKAYKQPPMIPQATLAPLPVFLQGKGPKPAPQPTPGAAYMGPQGKGPKVATSGPAAIGPQGNPASEPGVILPEGYVTGSAVPAEKGTEEDVFFGVDRTVEGDDAPEITKPLKVKTVPDLVAAKSSGSVTPDERLTLGVPEVTPENANIRTQPGAEPDRLGVKGFPTGETGATENRGGSFIKGQGATPTNPDCDPSVPVGQWLKIPRPGAEASDGTLTKGYGASAGGYPYGGGAKANKPAYGAGGHAVPGLMPGYGTGLGYGYAGKPKQPGYGQGAHLGAGYGNGNFHKGYKGYNAGVQPNYASLGQSTPTADGKSGGVKQTPYKGGPLVPAGLDGISQFEPQSAGLGLNGKLGSAYGGLGSLPFGGQTQGAEQTNAKYGIGGLQFAGQPISASTNGAGNYGGHGPGIGGVPAPGKYGYGRTAYQAQPVALGKYGLPASPYQPEHLGLGHSGKLGKYGGGEAVNSLQGFGGEAKSSGKYDNQGGYQLQPLGSTSEGGPGLPHQPVEPHSFGKPYVKGEVPTPAAAVEGVRMPVDSLDNVGYINGQVQPEVVAFPAAPTLSPTLAYPSIPPYLTGDSHLTSDAAPEARVEDLADPAAAASLNLDSAAAAEAQGVSQEQEQPDELQQQQQQLPRQIHIQQHLKLHFHPQNKSWRGANSGKHDLKGFFGNSGYQG